ncbi:peptide deformylase [bacterium]|nr:peptide deformylase [bacterium]
MRREILTLGAPILREKAKPVRKYDANLKKLIEDMIETMKSANGLGLAAPQIGISQRVIVVLQDDDSPLPLVNPQIVYAEGLDEGEEGCLSIPNLFGIVPRPWFVKVTGYNPKGKQVKVEAEGLLARALCHEIDHLDGILFIDKAYPNTLYWAEQGEAKETSAK